MIQSLPEAPGVYLFYGLMGELLYVGKSKAIRTRVRSHFSAPEERWMCRQILNVEAMRTAGELGALLLESRLIKELRPIYNVMSRHRRRLIVARRSTDRSGYAGIVLEAVDRIDPADTAPLMAVFKSRDQAKDYLASLVKSHGLCGRLLGLEKTRRTCFGYSLKQCRGACAGLEEAAAYNARVEEAFASRRIKAWPFRGAILIEERSGGTDEVEVFVVDNWCLLYSFTRKGDAPGLRVKGLHLFDYDSYKILCGYVLDEAHIASIRPASEAELRMFRCEPAPARREEA
ncbi:MAG: hypothetical protein WB626_07990 [Bacteroidota bacterium]